jgi:AcrR family transcriptional regulator
MTRRTPRGPADRLDRRVRRTRESLRAAIVRLVAQRGYAATRLDDVLAEADVGRSTFYAHYRDKDALFDTAMAHLEQELRCASQHDGRLLPFTRPMLDHVAAHAPGSASHVDVAVLQRMRRVLTRLAREDLMARVPSGGSAPLDLLVEHAIGSFLALVSAWVAAPRGRDAAAIDALYRELIVPGLERTLAG